MIPNARFRIQTGGLVLEIEGSEKFVLEGLNQHRSRIDTMLREQAVLIRDGNIPPRCRQWQTGPTPEKERRQASRARDWGSRGANP